MPVNSAMPLAHTVFRSGWCRQLEALAIRGGKWRPAVFPARWLLIEHAALGPIVVDTGYAERVLLACKKWPFNIYAQMTPMTLPVGETCFLQLEARGISSAEVKHVIITHFHADHLGGLKDFPNATFHASSAAWQSIRGLRGFAALHKAFIPELLPEEFESRLRLIDLDSVMPLGNGLAGADMFGDGCLFAIPLPGHARGQMGIYFKGVFGPVLWAADAAWRNETITDGLLPRRIAGLVMDSWEEFVETVESLRKVRDVEILLCHDDRISRQFLQ